MPLRKVAIEPSIDLLERILAPWQPRIGESFAGYRNHCYRVLHLCFYQHDPSPLERDKLITACAHHQLGAFVHPRSGAGGRLQLDHLAASCQLAGDYLASQGLEDWSADIDAILRHHQKLTKVNKTLARGDRNLAEIFRQAYVADLSMGFVKGHIAGPFLATVNDSFASEGYYRHLARGHLAWLRQHPTRPAPLFKW